MRLLVATPNWPHSAHSVRAANVVIHELVSALARSDGIEVGLLKVHLGKSEPLTREANEGIRTLQAREVTVLPPLALPIELSNARTGRRIPRYPRLESFHPLVAFRGQAFRVAEDFKADAILIPWSEEVTMLFAGAPATTFAYYGNPPPKVLRTRLEFERSHGGTASSYWRGRVVSAIYENIHLSEMSKINIIGDVAKNDAEYYRAKGHPRSFYIRNLWIDRFGASWRERRDAGPPSSILRLVGNIGKLSGTANTLGLQILSQCLLPELRKVLKGRPFEIHILGADEPHRAVAAMLEQPELKIRGFVNDIDAEMLSMPIFLCMNNASSFKVGHTRYLHAWSLGGCVIAHEDVRLSMPEIQHQKNALLGKDVQEIAELVAQAVCDPAMRRRLGEAGYQTFKEEFSPELVADRILTELKDAG